MIYVMESQTDSTIEIEMNGKMTKANFEKLAPAIKSKIDKYNKVNAIITVNQARGMTIGGFIEELKLGLKFLRDFEKIAIIGNREMLQKIVEAEAKILKLNMKYFDENNVEKARQWLREE